MPVDQSLVGRAFPPTAPYEVTEDHVREFVAATGGEYAGGPAPATYPIVMAFDAMNAFLEAEQVELHRIVHGESASPTSGRWCPATCCRPPSPSAACGRSGAPTSSAPPRRSPTP